LEISNQVKFNKTNNKYEEITNYLIKTKTLCDTAKFPDEDHKNICSNLDNIIRKEAEYLKNLITQINVIYKTPTNKRRGLIDGVGKIVKALFGTMDVDDEKHINEQLDLLENKQQVTLHAVKNQIRIINTTITNLDKFEGTIAHNKKLLSKQVTKFFNQIEIRNKRIF